MVSATIHQHTFHEAHLMRSWAGDGYLLELYETGHFEGNHTAVAYRFYDLEWEGRSDASPIFQGADYGVPSQMTIDGDDAVRGLLGFLSVRHGDTDDEFFADYTPRQLAWVSERAETLSLWSLDDTDLDTGEYTGEDE